MKKFFTLVCAALLALSASAETGTITLTADSLGLSTTAASGSKAVKASNGQSYTFAWTSANLQDDGTYGKNIKMAISSYLYNTDPIAIKSITVNRGGYYTSSANYTYYVYQGTTEKPTTSTYTSGSSRNASTDFSFTSGNEYFAIKQGSSSNMKFNSIVITFDYTPTAVEDVNVAKSAQVRKVMENGRIVIYNGDAKYDMMGARIK